MLEYLKENQLDMLVNELKQELIQTARATGINSPDTLIISQELDQLIVFKLKNHNAVVEVA